MIVLFCAFMLNSYLKLSVWNTKTAQTAHSFTQTTTSFTLHSFWKELVGCNLKSVQIEQHTVKHALKKGQDAPRQGRIRLNMGSNLLAIILNVSSKTQNLYSKMHLSVSTLNKTKTMENKI